MIRKRAQRPLIKRLLYFDIVSIDLSCGSEKADGAASLLFGSSCRALPLLGPLRSDKKYFVLTVREQPEACT